MRAQSNHPFDPESNAHYLLRLFDGWMGDANGPQKVLLLSAAAVLKNPSPPQLSASPQRCCERGREDRSMAGKIYDHPYVPRDLELPGYVPCALSQREIVVPYIGTSLLGVVLIWLLSGRLFKITKTDRLLMCWWAFTGLTHIILEGYFAFSPEFYKEKTPFFLAEVWKEYSKGDSRYAGRDAAVVSVEGITAALEGPASLLAVYAIGTRKPYSYILQFAICLGQLYGCLVYFATAFLLGDNFSTSPFYYWAYYIGANSSWCVVPVIIAIRCWKKISAACASEKKTKTY